MIHGSGGSRGEEKRDQPEEVKAALNNVKRRLKNKLENKTKQNKKIPYLTTRKQPGVWEAVLSSSFQEQVIHKHTSYHGN